jgi:ribonuclease III
MAATRRYVTELTDELLAACEEVIGYVFEERGLLCRALTHSSAARTRGESNERLEFLGDAILGSIVCEELYRRYPESSEGELTRIKSVIVSRETCAKVTHRLGLDEFLLMGKGLANGRRIPPSVCAAALEAIIGAIYLDGGRGVAQAFVLACVDELIHEVSDLTTGMNYKSVLQQMAQKEFGQTPGYHVLDEKGPDHFKSFKVCATIGSTHYCPAWGPSKKEAEQQAASNALAQIEGREVPSPAE